MQFTNIKRKPLSLVVSAIIAGTSMGLHAQEVEEQLVHQELEVDPSTLEQDKKVEEIVITGSRLRSTNFTNITPLQVIDADEARSLGEFSASDLLQNSSFSGGQQVDLTFSGFVLDNGPGAVTLNLRGLDSTASLVLINGRRMAPAGVEGAPTAPDLSLIPSGLVDQYDVLLDGASAVYGSDAIAGVVNVITRKDFDGFEIDVATDTPSQGGGEQTNLNLMWGKTGDRGRITFGAEVVKNERVTFNDREWTANCDKHYEVGLDGNFYTEDRYYQDLYGQQSGDCKVSALIGRVSVPRAGSIYFTDGYSNGGWPNFSESTYSWWTGTPFPVDGDGDGIADVSFRDYSRNGKDGDSDLYSASERASVYLEGEYTFEGETNFTTFFEVLHSQRKNEIRGRTPQLFPTVPADNPYNICNPNGEGVDCGLAFDALLDTVASDPNYVADFDATYGAGAFDFYYPNGFLYYGSLGAASVVPIVAVKGDRSNADVEVAQTRFVAGFTMDLPFMNVGTLSNWTFDASYSSSISDGKSSRTGIRGDRLMHSLSTTIEDPDNPGSYICGDGTDGCVPVNLFAPSLYNNGIEGDFATQAERDYVFDSRDFDTKYRQDVISAYATGEVFELQGGPAMMALGAEYRYDEIESIPDDVARDGLFFGFFSDPGAIGDKTTQEVFGEISLPLVAGVPGIAELTTDISARYTKDELYEGHSTYGVKIGYRPVESLLLRATQGTSYRAPNLRENFLKGVTGFNTLFDPCGVPEGAMVIDPADPTAPPTYDPSLDERDPEVLANCLATGVDPTALDFGGFNSYSTEVSRGGSTNLKEEQAESMTLGFAFEQPFWNEFDFDISFNYYEIEITDTIVNPSAQYIVNQCYNSQPGMLSSYCGSIERDAANDYRFDIINASFVNRDSHKVRGMDWNMLYAHDLSVADEPFTLRVQMMANRLLENSETYRDDQENEIFYESTGQFGYAEWTGNAQFQVQWENWLATWGMRFIGKVAQDPDYVDEYSDIYDTNGTGFTSDTCVGLANGGTDCRDVGFADEYLIHSLSLAYQGDDWLIRGGASNLFNEAPPRIDTNEVFGKNNTPLGVGYDLMGRSFFVQFQMQAF